MLEDMIAPEFTIGLWGWSEKQKWYFVLKIVLTYCDKKLFKNCKFSAFSIKLPNFLRSLEQFTRNSKQFWNRISSPHLQNQTMHCYLTIIIGTKLKKLSSKITRNANLWRQFLQLLMFEMCLFLMRIFPPRGRYHPICDQQMVWLYWPG
jgi:hypothetical protein